LVLLFSAANATFRVPSASAMLGGNDLMER
jgi:hypothetical protein